MQYLTRGCMCQLYKGFSLRDGAKQTSKSCTRNSQSTRVLWNYLF